MNSTGNHNTRGSTPRLGAPTPLPTLHDAEQAAFRTGWWNGKVVGFVLGMATASATGMAAMTCHPTATTTERRTKPRTAHSCQADRCRQGHRACPVPQACELPEEPPYTNAEITGFVLVVAAAVVGFCYLLFVGAGA